MATQTAGEPAPTTLGPHAAVVGLQWGDEGKSNRNFHPPGGDGTRKKLGQYGAYVLRREGQ